MKKMLFSFQALCLMIVGGFLFNATASANTVYVTLSGSDANVGFGPGSPRASIQEAVNDASPGDTVMIGAGTFVGQVNVNKAVEIIGAGPLAGGTFIGSMSGDRVFDLTATGTALNHIVFKKLRVDATAKKGFAAGTGTSGLNLSYFDFDSVQVWGTNLSPGTENERGLYVDLTSSLHNLTVVNCAFNNLHYGWYLHKQVSSDASTVDNVSVISTQFNHCNAKAIYAEKLSQAIFNDCQADGNGYDPSTVVPNFNGGFDINLKAGTYSNLQFLNCVFSNNGLGFKEGVGLTVKGRDDAPSYNGFPATVSNVLVDFCLFSGNERAVRFGEPGKNNLGPIGASVTRCSFINNNKTYAGVDGSAYGDVINQSQASVEAINNWWNTTSEPTIMTRKFGTVNHVPWLMHSTGDLTFKLGLNPAKPRINDDWVNLEFKVRKMSDSCNSIQFQVEASRSLLENNNVVATLYNLSGVPITELNVQKNIFNYTATSVIYQFALSPKTPMSFGTEWFHRKMAGDTNMYATLKLAFKSNKTAMAGSSMSFKVSDIIISEPNGAPIRPTLYGTRIVREETITHTFRPTGDINGDNAINVMDLMRIINHILKIAFLTGPEFEEGDLNRDDVIHVADATLMINIINGIPIPGVAGMVQQYWVMNSMDRNDHFVTKGVRIVYFTSDEEIELISGLEGASKIYWSEDKKSLSALFDEFTDVDIKFAKPVEGGRVGLPESATGVVEDLGTQDKMPKMNGQVVLFSADGRVVYTGQATEFALSNGAYFYILNGDNKKVTIGKFTVVK